MAIKTLIIKDFTGGIGTLGEKRDKPGSAKFTKALEPFEDTSYVTLARKATKKSSTTIAGLPHWMEDASPWNTHRYVYDSAGKIYQVTSSDTVSLLRTVSGGAGEGLKVLNDSLYYALATNLGRYTRLSSSPAFDDDFTNWGTVSDIQDTGGGTGAADYVPPTAISEAATARQTFTPTHDPIYSVTIDVDVVGSGDWTVTVHDELNNAIASETIVNSSMSTGDVEFVMDSVGRVLIGNEYHFHVTSTVADGGVDTSSATDLEAAEYTVEYAPLISATWHPMVVVDNQDLIIGNERYLGKWDESTYDPNYISLDNGYSVRSIAAFEEFICAVAYKGSSINEAEEAKIYFWDGITPTFNYSSPVTIGVPNAIHNSKGELVGVYGTRGSFYRGADPFQQVVHEIPKLARGKYVEVYPGAIDEFQGRTLVGYAGVTDDSSGVELGVYEYGNQSDELNPTFNFPYLISTGNTQATNQKIGLVKVIGNDIYIGWRDDSSYGLDKIAYGDNSAAQGEYESLIFDGGDPNKEFNPMNIIITFESLATNESVTPKYKKNRASSFTNGTAVTSGTRAEEPVYGRCKEMEIGFILASSDGTFPKITSIQLEYDDLSEESTNE